MSANVTASVTTREGWPERWYAEDLADTMLALAATVTAVHLCRANKAEAQAYLLDQPQQELWPMPSHREVIRGELLLGVSVRTARLLDICTATEVTPTGDCEWEVDWTDDIR